MSGLGGGGGPCSPCKPGRSGDGAGPGLAGTALSLITAGIVIVMSVRGAWLPEAVTGVLYICQHSSFYGLQLQHEIALFIIILALGKAVTMWG